MALGDFAFAAAEPSGVECRATHRRLNVLSTTAARCDIAKRHGLVVVEDAGHAHGARFQGKGPGALSHAAAFSFCPTKNLGALGDAGAVVSNDAVVSAAPATVGSS